MRLPSSTSLLLSLAVSSSSSSLSALAAPTGDFPDSSSPAVKRDDMAVQPDSASTSCSMLFFSDAAIDHLPSGGLLDNIVALFPPPLDGTVKKVLGLPPKARADPSSLAVGSVMQQTAPLMGKLVHARMATRAEEGDPDEDPTAAPDDGAKTPAAPAGAPQPPSAPAPELPVKPPAPVPQLPGVNPPVERRDSGGVSDVPMVVPMLSPNIPRNPPNTPVPRQLLPLNDSSLPVNLPGQ
jgi:hypothetical protein